MEHTNVNDKEEGLTPSVDFEKRGGYVPVVVQEAEGGAVLMLGYANSQALEKTLRTGFATFFSTSRQELWTKGETSGNRLIIKSVSVDCDQDALLYVVDLERGGACHTRNRHGEARKSCFYREFGQDGNLTKTEI